MQITVQIKAQTQASKDEFVKEKDGSFKVKVTTVPEDGKANKQIIKFLSKQMKVAKSDIEIIKGNTSKIKLLKINLSDKSINIFA